MAVANLFPITFKKFLTVAAAAVVVSTSFTVSDASAQAFKPSDAQQGRDNGQYIPSIWMDPDGCEHWVMDDGAEGFMTPHVNRQGIPVCRRSNLCGVMQADQFFQTNHFNINAAGKKRLSEFFTNSTAVSFIIVGHTDSRASDAYNLRLSLNRANSVAAVARASGATIADVRGLGERVPAAANNSAQGLAKNRRVEIFCIQ